ncbi:MAG: hypothetical protein GF381_00905, partial [Candidatus Pacebacteria bacterium]|nr:hypothetical protein [Candidatus Paceibacterota bacterium]
QSSSKKSQNTQVIPHILTMSATPIPRSLMLTIFSHLEISILDEMPFGQKPIETWLTPQTKRLDGYRWIGQQLEKKPNNLALVVCPFIDPSDHEAFTDVKAATQVHQELEKLLSNQPSIKLALLHGRQKKAKQEKIIKQLYSKKINLLVTTTIVEVGVDLPQANIISIESADRFGLASLHQLRGRVGRQGQQSYCLLFSSSGGEATRKRLKLFAQETNGIKLAEQDLKNRGAGDLFGTRQSGLDELRFASWTNLELISLARKIALKIKTQNLDWKPLIEPTTDHNTKVAAN